MKNVCPLLLSAALLTTAASAQAPATTTSEATRDGGAAAAPSPGGGAGAAAGVEASSPVGQVEVAQWPKKRAEQLAFLARDAKAGFPALWAIASKSPAATGRGFIAPTFEGAESSSILVQEAGPQAPAAKMYDVSWKGLSRKEARARFDALKKEGTKVFRACCKLEAMPDERSVYWSDPTSYDYEIKLVLFERPDKKWDLNLRASHITR